MENHDNELNFKEMNVYQKLNYARKDLLETLMEKTGTNSFVNFDYYKVIDLVTHIHPLNNKIGLLYIPNYYPETETAGITIVNTDKPEEKIDMRICLKESRQIATGGKEYKLENPIANSGATITYGIRYLLITAYGLDSTDKAEEGIKKDYTAKQQDNNTSYNNSGNNKSHNKTSGTYSKNTKPATTTVPTKPVISAPPTPPIVEEIAPEKLESVKVYISNNFEELSPFLQQDFLSEYKLGDLKGFLHSAKYEQLKSMGNKIFNELKDTNKGVE